MPTQQETHTCQKSSDILVSGLTYLSLMEIDPEFGLRNLVRQKKQVNIGDDAQ